MTSSKEVHVTPLGDLTTSSCLASKKTPKEWVYEQQI